MTIEAIPVRRPTSKPVQVAAAVIGNALEWYDFIIFGFLTVVISRLFFPAESQYASLLLTAATFGVGFLMRPVGGVLLGIYADRKGRKAALQLIIGLMTVAIGMVAFAPTYAAIGIAAPLVMVLARLLQGLATGGEFASATSFLIESAPRLLWVMADVRPRRCIALGRFRKCRRNARPYIRSTGRLGLEDTIFIWARHRPNRPLHSSPS
jgi:MFS family permease